MCAIAILRAEKGMLIGVIDVVCYGKITCSALARALGFNGSVTAVTLKVENILGNDDTFYVTLNVG